MNGAKKLAVLVSFTTVVEFTWYGIIILSNVQASHIFVRKNISREQIEYAFEYFAGYLLDLWHLQYFICFVYQVF